MIFSAQAKPRKVKSSNLLTLIDWAQHYNKHGPQVRPWYIRFQIAVYQLDGIHNPEFRNEAKGAFFMNMLLCVEDLARVHNCSGVEVHIPLQLHRPDCSVIHHKELLQVLAAATRHNTYGSTWNETARARRRFDKAVLVRSISSMMQGILFSIPKKERSSAIEAATAILAEEKI